MWDPPDNLAHRTNSGGDTRYVFEYGFREEKKKMELQVSSHKNYNISLQQNGQMD